MIPAKVHQVPADPAGVAQGSQPAGLTATQWLDAHQRLTAVGHDQRRSSFLHLLEKCDTASLELGNADLFHGSTLTWSIDQVKW